MGNVRRLRLEELRIETGLRLHMNPGAILEPAAILLQSVNGTANGPVLVLYTPAVLFVHCAGIAKGSRIASRLRISVKGLRCFCGECYATEKSPRELSPFWVDFRLPKVAVKWMQLS